jgi:hypothetical protein
MAALCLLCSCRREVSDPAWGRLARFNDFNNSVTNGMAGQQVLSLLSSRPYRSTSNSIIVEWNGRYPDMDSSPLCHKEFEYVFDHGDILTDRRMVVIRRSKYGL